MIELMPDSLALLTRNICDLLRYAGEPVNPQTLAKAVSTMQLTEEDFKDERLRNQFFHHCMVKAHENGDVRFTVLFEYFVIRKVNRHIRDSLLAVLNEIDAAMKTLRR